MTTARLAALAVAAAACGTAPPGPALVLDHPVPTGQWPPTTGDAWPGSLQAAGELRGCAAYGGVPVRSVVQTPTVIQVQGVAGLDLEGNPVILINPTMLGAESLSLAFLFLHECAHHHLQHPAYAAVGTPGDPVLREYDANCEAAAFGLTRGLLERRDIDFLRLVLDNNSGPERPPGQGRAFIDCLQDRGLY